MDKVKTTAWVAVDKNFEFTEHVSMQAALEVKPFVLFCEKKGVWQNGPYQNYAYDAAFFNDKGLKTDGIKLNNWYLSNLRVTTGESRTSYSRSIIMLTVFDPLGSSQVRSFGNERSGIISALVFLKAVSQYNSWEIFRQSDPSEKEKSQIQLLKGEVERLTNENRILLERLEKIQKIASNEPNEHSLDLNSFRAELESQSTIGF